MSSFQVLRFQGKPEKKPVRTRHCGLINLFTYLFVWIVKINWLLYTQITPRDCSVLLCPFFLTTFLGTAAYRKVSLWLVAFIGRCRNVWQVCSSISCHQKPVTRLCAFATDFTSMSAEKTNKNDYESSYRCLCKSCRKGEIFLFECIK